MSDARQTLRVLAEVADGYPGDIEAWSSADEVAHRMGTAALPKAAQTMGRRLRQLERRGLVESRAECWGFMYRLSAPVRDLLAPAPGGPGPVTREGENE